MRWKAVGRVVGMEGQTKKFFIWNYQYNFHIKVPTKYYSMSMFGIHHRLSDLGNEIYMSNKWSIQIHVYWLILINWYEKSCIYKHNHYCIPISISECSNKIEIGAVYTLNAYRFRAYKSMALTLINSN